MPPVRCGPVSLVAVAANSEFNRRRRKLPLFLDFWIRRLFHHSASVPEVSLDDVLVEIGQLATTPCDPTQQTTDQAA
jgi:hypothetical protein